MAHKHILNLGAGVQSTTLALMFDAGEIRYSSVIPDRPWICSDCFAGYGTQPFGVCGVLGCVGIVVPQGEMFERFGDRPIELEAAVMADVQEEPEAVYKHVEYLQKRLSYPVIIRTAGKLGDDLVHGRNTTGGRFAAIPAFTTKDGGTTVGRTRRQCSKEYKTEVIERAVRRDIFGLEPNKRIPKGNIVHQYIGISLDEAGRAKRISDRFRGISRNPAKPARAVRWARVHFPLIDRHMTRTNCTDYLAPRVPHEVPRSACVFCPFHSDAEWLRLKNEDPAAWQRAVTVDMALRDSGSVANRDMDQVMYLHRSCKPLDLVQLNPNPTEREKQINMNFWEECEGVCGN